MSARSDPLLSSPHPALRRLTGAQKKTRSGERAFARGCGFNPYKSPRSFNEVIIRIIAIADPWFMGANVTPAPGRLSTSILGTKWVLPAYGEVAANIRARPGPGSQEGAPDHGGDWEPVGASKGAGPVLGLESIYSDHSRVSRGKGLTRYAELSRSKGAAGQ